MGLLGVAVGIRSFWVGVSEHRTKDTRPNFPKTVCVNVLTLCVNVFTPGWRMAQSVAGGRPRSPLSSPPGLRTRSDIRSQMSATTLHPTLHTPCSSCTHSAHGRAQHDANTFRRGWPPPGQS